MVQSEEQRRAEQTPALPSASPRGRHDPLLLHERVDPLVWSDALDGTPYKEAE